MANKRKKLISEATTKRKKHNTQNEETLQLTDIKEETIPPKKRVTIPPPMQEEEEEEKETMTPPIASKPPQNGIQNPPPPPPPPPPPQQPPPPPLQPLESNQAAVDNDESSDTKQEPTTDDTPKCEVCLVKMKMENDLIPCSACHKLWHFSCIPTSHGVPHASRAWLCEVCSRDDILKSDSLEICDVCQESGDTISCCSCSQSYHIKCIEQHQQIKKNVWNCLFCESSNVYVSKYAQSRQRKNAVRNAIDDTAPYTSSCNSGLSFKYLEKENISPNVHVDIVRDRLEMTHKHGAWLRNGNVWYECGEEGPVLSPENEHQHYIKMARKAMDLAINHTGSVRTEGYIRRNAPKKRPSPSATGAARGDGSTISFRDHLASLKSGVHLHLRFPSKYMTKKREKTLQLASKKYFAQPGTERIKSRPFRMGKSSIQGWGLFATRYIERFTILSEYVGEFISPKLADEREANHIRSGFHSNYMFAVGDRIIDGTSRGGIARYMNHSCAPNCFSHTVTVDEQKKIIIATDRAVLQGEELTYDYMFEFEPGAPKVLCNCGAISCRGTLN